MSNPNQNQQGGQGGQGGQKQDDQHRQGGQQGNPGQQGGGQRQDQQKQDQHHGKQQYAVVGQGRRQRYGKHCARNGDRPIRRAVDTIAPTRHAPHLGAIVVRDEGDVL